MCHVRISRELAEPLRKIARNPETVKDVYTRLKAEARRIGLAINTTETKHMKGRGSTNDDPPCLTSVAVDGDELEEVLGSLMTADNDTSQEIQTCIHAGNRETWTMRQEDERALEVCKRKALRTIYGGVLTAENV